LVVVAYVALAFVLGFVIFAQPIVALAASAAKSLF
jgi:hypothetical protein